MYSLDIHETARLTDFGLAMSATDIEGEESKSGTHAYMAPEVLSGESPSAKSDLYALELVLYEAVTNRRAFRTGPEIARRAERGKSPPPPSRLIQGVDPVLDRVIRRCLAPRAEDRPESGRVPAGGTPV